MFGFGVDDCEVDVVFGVRDGLFPEEGFAVYIDEGWKVVRIVKRITLS